MPPDVPISEMLKRLAEYARTEPDPLAEDRPPPRRHALPVSVAAALVLVVALVGAALVARHGGRDPVATAGEPRALPGGLTERLTDAGLPGRMFAASVWTGREVLVWGGMTVGPPGQRLLADGAALDPVANRWRALPPAPLAARSSPAAVWTGTEMLVSGGDGGEGLADGAAFNPETNRWRPIAAQPSGGTSRPAAVWTGTEMMLLTSGNPAGMSAYDPRTDRWRTAAAPPGTLAGPYPQVVWAAGELIAVVSPSASVGPVGPVRVPALAPAPAAPPSVSGGPVGTPAPPVTVTPGPPPGLPDISSLPMQGPNWNMFLASYSPASDQWTALPTVPLRDSGLPILVWTGREVLVLQARMAGAAFDVRRRTWRPLAELPLGTVPITSAQWSGRLALFWSGGEYGLAYDPSTDTWHTFDAGGLEPRTEGVVTWAGDFLIGWGGIGQRDGTSRIAGDGIRYRPPAA